MSTRRSEWVKLPTQWIQDGGLKALRWSDGEGASSIAALMLLIALAHSADQTTGLTRATYDHLQVATSLSRATVSHGLRKLDGLGIIEREPSGQSTYRVCNLDPSNGWGKLPYKGLYQRDEIEAFTNFKLRRREELNALKLYLLFVTRRGNDTNAANIGYEAISTYSGIETSRIKSALSVLLVHQLIQIDQVPSTSSAFGIAHAYRLSHLDTRTHMGTAGRRQV